ncbi:MAG: hypothetical protein QM769_03050 [Pseudoxanthomonas sp.]
MNKKGLVIFSIVSLLIVVAITVSQPGPQTPLVDYDWSTFVENPRLSQDFTSSVREALDPQHTERNPYWLQMKRDNVRRAGLSGLS